MPGKARAISTARATSASRSWPGVGRTWIVISRPQLLLADEPTGNVDPNLAHRLLRLFIELNKSGTTVLIATHDINLMDQYDARRLVLHEGRMHVYD